MSITEIPDPLGEKIEVRLPGKEAIVELCVSPSGTDPWLLFDIFCWETINENKKLFKDYRVTKIKE